MHIDVQLTSDDFDATPRREQLVMWLWLSDVTEDSGAMVSDHATITPPLPLPLSSLSWPLTHRRPACCRGFSRAPTAR